MKNPEPQAGAPDGAAPPRVIFIASSDPLDVHSFSGVLMPMVRELRAVFPDMEVVRRSRPAWFRRLQAIVTRATKGRADPYYWTALNRYFARRLARRWRRQRVVVIAVVNASLVAELAAMVPVINVTDSTFELMRNFYASFATYDSPTAVAAEEAERRSIVRSVHNSFSSRWAARSATGHYGAPEDQVSVISWGCNLDEVPSDEVRQADSGRATCRLLFVTGDWIRKGGDVVIETTKLLQARGCPVHVDIIGAPSPEDLSDLPWIEHRGFLSKAKEQQFATYRTLLRESDFLYSPTRQDCTPMVFAEANAYGTPVVTRDVGGVADVVRDGVNGIVLPEGAEPVDFADAIEAAWRDQDRFGALRRSARQEYEQRLNWGSWAQAIGGIVSNLQRDGRI